MLTIPIPIGSDTFATPSNPKFCADLGRTLFQTYIGRYFTTVPRGKTLPAGTACAVCGSTDIQLWESGTGQPQCLPQITITRKRAGRKSADEPCIPVPNVGGMVAFGEGSMTVAGPHVACLITRVLPDIPLPSDGLEIKFPEKGSITRAVIGLITHPPPPPFVVIIFGKKAGFRSTVTVDASRIAISGPDGYTVDTAYIRELLLLFDGLHGKAVSDILHLRDRLALGEHTEAERQTLITLRTEHPAIAAALRRLPSPGDPAATMLRRLLSSA